jgi:galactokinase
VAAGPRRDGGVRAAAVAFDDTRQWPLAEWRATAQPGWTSYVAGVAALVHDHAANLSGCDLLIDSTVPVGGGLSSSAALEVATAKALLALTGCHLPDVAVADLARSAEHDYAGVPCGIMDQYVSTLARANCAFLLDCRTRTWEHIPLDLGEHVILIVDSGVRHELATGEYAVRHRQCGAAVATLQRHRPGLTALRDADETLIARHADELGTLVAARARHVVGENARTCAAAAALRAGDLVEFGRLMDASHRSLRDDYAVSCPEVDRLVAIVRAVPGVCGARMTGGGFGGCIVALAARSALPQVEAAIANDYNGVGFGPARVILSRPGPGASIEYP